MKTCASRGGSSKTCAARGVDDSGTSILTAFFFDFCAAAAAAAAAAIYVGVSNGSENGLPQLKLSIHFLAWIKFSITLIVGEVKCSAGQFLRNILVMFPSLLVSHKFLEA